MQTIDIQVLTGALEVAWHVESSIEEINLSRRRA
jgi:hypothetical protein